MKGIFDAFRNVGNASEEAFLQNEAAWNFQKDVKTKHVEKCVWSLSKIILEKERRDQGRYLISILSKIRSAKKLSQNEIFLSYRVPFPNDREVAS